MGLGNLIIILILWSAASILGMVQYAPYCKELKSSDQLIVGVIFIIGGPFFLIANALTGVLDSILPEGWDQDGQGYC